MAEATVSAQLGRTILSWRKVSTTSRTSASGPARSAMLLIVTPQHPDASISILDTYSSSSVMIQALYKVLLRHAEDETLANDDRAVHLEAAARAQRTVSKAAAINWPIPVDRRLDQLVEMANDAGAATSRGELAAALVADAGADGDELLRLVLAWRTALVRDVVVQVAEDATIVVLPRFGPGRRKKPSA